MKSKVVCNIKDCTHPRQRLVGNEWVCSTFDLGEIIRRPLTDHERLKLSWYRSEKKWIENIRDRKIINKNGQKIVISQGRELPMQPRQYWPKPKGGDR